MVEFHDLFRRKMAYGLSTQQQHEFRGLFELLDRVHQEQA